MHQTSTYLIAFAFALNFGYLTYCSSGVLWTTAFTHVQNNHLRRTKPPQNDLYDLRSKSVYETYHNQHRDQAGIDKDGIFRNRRECLASLATYGASAMIMNAKAASAKVDLSETNTLQLQEEQGDVNSPVTITLPLEPSSGNTFCVRITVYASDSNAKPRGISGRGGSNANEAFRIYRAIVDTGSPYLVLPSPGHKDNEPNIFQWAKNAFASTQEVEESLLLSSSGYPPTEEIYGAVKGQINWNMASYSFRDPRLIIKPNGKGMKDINQSTSTNADGVVGVLDDALTNEATGGGTIEPSALLGLIQNSNPNADRSRFPDPRPTFFEQERIQTGSAKDEYNSIKSFSINGPDRELTLSTQTMIPATAPAMPLVDLRTYGDFVDHYSVAVDSVSFDDISISSKGLGNILGSKFERPIVAVFDTGLTGCLLIRPFWDAVQKYMSAKSSVSDDFQSVSLSLREVQRQKQSTGSTICNIKSSTKDDRRFYVQPIDLDWFDDEQSSPYVIVLGQTFLSRGTLTIDIDERAASFKT